MTVGVLLITHEGVGEALLDTAGNVFDGAPLAVAVLSVPRNSDPDRCLQDALDLARTLDSGDGVLVLSDMFGSTPGNIAVRVAEALNGKMVSGVNLPMLIRVFNYPTLALSELAARAVEGGRAGVVA
jgi:PTS system ascorbate-specific IIA component